MKILKKYGIQKLKNLCKNNILSIVGNKCDLYEYEAVEEEEVNSFAEKVGGIYYEISTKNGNGIDEMFESLEKMYLEPDFKDKLEKSQSLKEDSVKLDKRKLSKRNKKIKILLLIIKNLKKINSSGILLNLIFFKS